MPDKVTFVKSFASKQWFLHDFGTVNGKQTKKQTKETWSYNDADMWCKTVIVKQRTVLNTWNGTQLTFPDTEQSFNIQVRGLVFSPFLSI